jgi:ATP-dependent DNA helicase RecG
LARQHFVFFSNFFGLDFETVFLSGSVTKKERAAAYEKIASKQSLMIVGTHALIEEAVGYAKLGLVITDEQHRFGVAQRVRLAGKGETPHTLVMSATPIPRTLALTLYGDLDVSVMDGMPPGRQYIETFVVASSMRTRALNFISREAAAGRQAYIICPAIEENDALETRSVLTHAESVKTWLPNLSVGALHGKMKNSEKDAIMTDFSVGRLQVLVSTTVVEVGVNVPNATVMLIENAERFGLSQLHQLRGRVGRGKHKSYCLLFCDSRSKNTLERLNVMKSTNDGFKIAELDLKLRGAGDFFGTRQSGVAEFKIANVYEDMAVLELAQRAAAVINSGGAASSDKIDRQAELYLKNQRNISGIYS